MANCSYTVPDLEASGDSFYGRRICDQPVYRLGLANSRLQRHLLAGRVGLRRCLQRAKATRALLERDLAPQLFRRGLQQRGLEHRRAALGRPVCARTIQQYDDLRAMCGDGSATAVTTGCQQARQWNAWRCTQGYDEVKRDCRSWFFLFAWICHLWAEIRRFVCTLWGIGFRDGLHLMVWNGRRRQNVTLTLWFFYPLDGSGTPDLSRAPALLSTKPATSGISPTMPNSRQVPSMEQAGMVLTLRRNLNAHGCSAPFTCGGSMRLEHARRSRCVRLQNNART